MDTEVIILSVSRDHEAVMLRTPSDPPLTGGGQRWQSGSIVGQETLPNMPSPTKQKKGGHAPSFIGELAAIHWIGLSQRLSWQYSQS